LNIRLDEIGFAYPGNPPIFDQLNLSIPLPGWTAITGECGAGKTTLAKLIAGLLKPTSGSIYFEKDNRREVPATIGYLFQNPDDQFVHFNIGREVAFNLENHGVHPTVVRQAVQRILKNTRLYDRRNDSPHDLSGGEKQKLALADWLISQPQLLILDEPGAFLDIPTRYELYQNIRDLIINGLRILWITQDETEIAMADYVIVLERGRPVRLCSQKDIWPIE